MTCLEREFGFARTTPVQAACIPQMLQRKDVAVEAVTGSGKTLAFVVPLVEMLRQCKPAFRKSEVGAIILSPVRDLAHQTVAVLRRLASVVMPHLSLLELVGGGQSIEQDLLAFARHGGAVIVATPGRLAAFLARLPRGTTSRLELLVLDEADQLLDARFRADVDAVLALLPKSNRRTALFSATQTQEVDDLVRAGLRNPVRLTVRVTSKKHPAQPAATAAAADSHHARTQHSLPTTLRNFFVSIEADAKVSLLVQTLLSPDFATAKVIVYFATRASVDFFAKLLKRVLPAERAMVLGLHGKADNEQRQKTYRRFVTSTATQTSVLLATDVASRGIDFPNVDWVIQFDPPQNPDAFVHRVGRTARAGRRGAAIIFLLPSETAFVDFAANRAVQLVERDACVAEALAAADELTATVRAWVVTDRDLVERGIQAFASLVRAYREHRLSYLFALSQLPLGKLANAYGLLFFPRMPEARGNRHVREFKTPSFRVRFSDIPFKDPMREKKRQTALRGDTGAADADAEPVAEPIVPDDVDEQPRDGTEQADMKPYAKEAAFAATRERRDAIKAVSKDRFVSEAQQAMQAAGLYLDENGVFQVGAAPSRKRSHDDDDDDDNDDEDEEVERRNDDGDDDEDEPDDVTLEEGEGAPVVWHEDDEGRVRSSSKLKKKKKKARIGGASKRPLVR